MNRIILHLPFWDRVLDLDKHLLLNYRLLWISKVHFVLFFSIFGIGLFSSIALLLPIGLSIGVSSWGIFFTLTIILGILGFFTWAYYQSIYNLEKNFAILPKSYSLATVSLNMICISAFFALTVIPTYIYKSRAASFVSRLEILGDVEKLKVVNFAFTTQRDLEQYYTDNIWQVNQEAENYVGELNGAYNQSTAFFNIWGHYSKMVEEAKIDSYDESETEVAESFFKKIEKDLTLSNLNAYIATMKKYGANINVSAEQVLAAFKKKETLFDREFHHQKVKVLDNINSFYSAHSELEFYTNFMSYLVLLSIIYYLSMGVMLYKALGMKEFIITGAVAAIALPISFAVIGDFFGEKQLLKYLLALLSLGGIGICLLTNTRKFIRPVQMLIVFSQALVPFAVIAFLELENKEALLIFSLVLLIHGFILLPIYQRFYLQQRALPKNALS